MPSNRVFMDNLASLMQAAIVEAFQSDITPISGTEWHCISKAGPFVLVFYGPESGSKRGEWLPPWVHVRFENNELAKAELGSHAGARLNPFSGKWNWHPSDPIQVPWMQRAITEIEPHLVRVATR